MILKYLFLALHIGATSVFAQECLSYFTARDSQLHPFRRPHLEVVSREKPAQKTAELLLPSNKESENIRTLQIIKNYTGLIPHNTLTLAFSRLRNESGAETHGTFEASLLLADVGFILKIDGTTKFVIHTESKDDIKALSVNSELVLQWISSRSKKTITLKKDDAGNIFAIHVDEVIGQFYKKSILLDNIIVSRRDRPFSNHKTPLKGEHNDGYSIINGIQKYFSRQIKNSSSNIIRINFAKFSDSDGKESFQQNTLTIEIGYVTKLRVGIRSLGIIAGNRSTVNLVPTSKKDELHLEWIRDDSVRHTFFQKDDLGNISSVTIIDEFPNSSGEPTLKLSIYSN